MDPATILELLMEKATLLKKVLEVLRGQFSKANFAFSSTGLELQAVDTKCIALVVLQLHSKAFGSYICNNDDLSVGLNLADMDKAFSSANNDEIVTIEAKDEENAVFITFESPDGSEIDYCKFSFMGVDVVPVAIQEFQESEYQAIIRMPSTDLMDFCNQFSSFTGGMEIDVVCITVDKDYAHFYNEGIHGALIIECKSEGATKVEMKEKVSVTFSLRYLSSLCKAFALCHQVTIKLSSKVPALFEYNIPEMGYIRYYVIPKELQVEM